MIDRAAVGRLATAAGLGPVTELVPLAGGANNRVFRVEAAGGPALLKAYFRHPDDRRDRLGAEFAFARFARAAGVRCIPEPLAALPESSLGLFAFIDGQPVAEATEPLVARAADFVHHLNAARWRPAASPLPMASEACFSFAEHLGTVAGRVERLLDITDSAAAAFVRREVLPAWEQVRAEASDSGPSPDRVLEHTARCVSPSDFGFHNALLQPDGRLCFLDFEYAGWDDPAKLICDFFCQPRVPVPLHLFAFFARAVAECFSEPDSVVARARVLLPVYQVKWVCIRLNEFLPAGQRRRAFALSPSELAARQARQLAQARTALRHHERITA